MTWQYGIPSLLALTCLALVIWALAIWSAVTKRKERLAKRREPADSGTTPD